MASEMIALIGKPNREESGAIPGQFRGSSGEVPGETAVNCPK